MFEDFSSGMYVRSAILLTRSSEDYLMRGQGLMLWYCTGLQTAMIQPFFPIQGEHYHVQFDAKPKAEHFMR